MSISSETAMDVDSPSGSGGTLKRSSSAPMINDINTTMATSPSTNSSSRDSMSFNLFTPSSQTRTRRFSTSFSPVPGSPGLSPRLAPRVDQLRQEERVDTTNLREITHERDIHCAMQMSQSWEDLTLVNNESPNCNNKDTNTNTNTNSENQLKPPKDCTKTTPLHLNLGPYTPLTSQSSPSPTRPGFQPFSPSTFTPWNRLSPSPTRKPNTYYTRRSLSPIALRASPLGPVKRKLDDDKDLYSSPRAKRFNSYSASDRVGLLVTHNNTSSPLPGSLSSIGTPESLSSADSPGFTFRPVDSPSPNRPLQTSGDEPMHEEQSVTNSVTQPKIDEIMTSVEQSPS